MWSRENPRAFKSRKSQRQFSVNVWCAIIDNKLIGPYVLPNRLNGAAYLDFWTHVLPNLLQQQNVTVRGMYYQHDGAPAHFSHNVTEHLNNQFPGHWIGRGGPIAWPARSPDLTVLDYFLWGHMKSIVYEEPINSREHLIERINLACERIRETPDMIRKSVGHLVQRARLCLEEDGGIFENKL